MKKISFFCFFNISLLLLFSCKSWDYNGFQSFATNDEMIAYCNKQIEQQQEDPRYYFFRGIAYSYENKFIEANNDFTEVIKLDPQNIDAYYNRGLNLIKLKEYDNAIKNFDIVLKLSRRLFHKNRLMKIQAYSMLCTAYMKKEQYQTAMFFLDKAEQLEPQNPKLLQKKAMLLFYQGETKDSISIFEHLIAKYPADDISIFNYLMVMLHDNQYLIENKNIFAKYVRYYCEKYPLSYQSFFLKSRMYFLFDDIELAKKNLDSAFKRFDSGMQPNLWQEMTDLKAQLDEKK